MAEKNVTQAIITDDQVDCVLNDIAMTANTIKRFSIMLVHAQDERDVEAITRGIENLADRIGLLADMTADKRASSGGGIGAVFSDLPEVWMMPPSYHEAPSRPVQE